MRVARLRLWILGAALALLLALAFVAYLQPTFVVDLANRWIFCQ